jgi:hypothetical protein
MCPLGCSKSATCAKRCCDCEQLVQSVGFLLRIALSGCRHQNSAIAFGTSSWSATSTVFKLIEHRSTAQKLSGMNSNSDSPASEEDNRVSVLLATPRLNTPLARTPCSAALSHDLEVVQKSFHNISDVRRLMRIKPIPRERHWGQLRQAHVNNGTIPKVMGLDALFYRFASERSYCQRLSNLVPPDVPAALSTDLLCISPPWVSGHWPDNFPFASRQRHSYPTTGDLPDPEDSSCARDSASALWAGTTRWGTGDPGRLLQEIRKEHRIAANHELLVTWQNKEFQSMPTALSRIFYVPEPEWWFADGWTSAHMFVPHPPVLTYRASRLLPKASHRGEAKFWWTVFEAERITLVFSRFCADIVQRRIMWRLPMRARLGISTMGVAQLLQGSTYGISDVKTWLCDHDLHHWNKKRMSYVERRPTADGPALTKELTEFVRLYESIGAQRGTYSRRQLPNYHRRSSPVAYDVDSQVEDTTQSTSQSPTVSHTDHRSPESPIFGSPESPTFKPRADLTIQNVPRTSSISKSVAPMATPKETQPVGSEGPFVFTEDSALKPSLIKRLQERRILPTIQKYCRASYARDSSGYQPYTELVLADAIDCLEDSLRATEK